MAIQRYEPNDVWSRMQQQMNQLMRGFDSDFEGSNVATSKWMPLVDIKEEPNRFLIRADVPGVDAKDIDISMENGVLTLRGERSEEKEEDRKGYHRVERSSGSFYRRFSLPDVADSDKISARCHNGVLEIEVPKKEVMSARKIEVKT